MLTALTIQNFGLIQKATLSLNSGLTVMTGETGAGKSMLTGALSFCLGKKPDFKTNAPCTVEAIFEISPTNPLLPVLDEQGIELEEGELILRRTWADGKSKAFANGVRLTQSSLQTLAPMLVDMHGQHDQQLLMNEKNHGTLLDSFGHLTPQTTQVKKAYQAWKLQQKALDDILEKQDNQAREETLLRAFTEELDILAYQPEEEKELEAEKKRQLAGEQVITSVQEAMNALDGEQGALAQLSNAERAMRIAGEKAEGDVAELAQNLWDVYNQAMDLSRDVARMGENFSPNPARLQEVDDRLQALKDCARKHKVDMADLSLLQQKFQAELNGFDTLQEDISALKKKTEAARTAFEKECHALSAARQKTAIQMAKKVEAALKHLKMAGTQFKAQFTPLENWGAQGAESITFHVATNAGMPMAPLADAASGGEISRLMLALKSIFYADIPPMTLIFDEVDTGIGGAVADAAGEALKTLSAQHQVLTITHQPQVAAKGHSHLLIEKQVKAGTTLTHVKVLDDVARKFEVARMLSGQEVTKEAEQAAASLLKAAS